MRRREFITLFSGTALAWAIAARAQRSGVPVIGFRGAVLSSYGIGGRPGPWGLTEGCVDTAVTSRPPCPPHQRNTGAKLVQLSPWLRSEGGPYPCPCRCRRSQQRLPQRELRPKR